MPRDGAGDRSLKILKEHGPLKNLILRALRRPYLILMGKCDTIWFKIIEEACSLCLNTSLWTSELTLQLPVAIWLCVEAFSKFQGIHPSKSSPQPKIDGIFSYKYLSPLSLGRLILSMYFMPFLRNFPVELSPSHPRGDLPAIMPFIGYLPSHVTSYLPSGVSWDHPPRSTTSLESWTQGLPGGSLL